MNKESFIEAEKEYYFNSCEFGRIGLSDFDDRKECDIHNISFRWSEAPWSKEGTDCPLCVLREIFSYTPKGIELTKDEYETKLKERGWKKSQIKNIIAYMYSKESIAHFHKDQEESK